MRGGAGPETGPGASGDGRRNCEFQLLRYVPDAVRNEFVHIGVILREQGAQAGEPAMECGSRATGAGCAVSIPTRILLCWRAWKPNCADGCGKTPTAK